MYNICNLINLVNGNYSNFVSKYKKTIVNYFFKILDLSDVIKLNNIRLF